MKSIKGIEGITHYSKRSKKSKIFRLWILIIVFVALAIAIYYYLVGGVQQILKNPKTGLIVIKEPKIELNEIENKYPVNDKANIHTQEHKLLENLDELNQIIQPEYKK